ncbi:transposase [Breznakia sp. PF5-3]|uniref:IS110 family transposase n=1 Tax=unclassified Breznakia TaxID=2623764 RepID=UPI0024051B36|nr:MULTISPECIES: IS110 family transposase [unclassified Breznakia]MDF9825911.1 transposase [Breznakia sp. PM6-1]MDF9836706.1 transposase [Breznakia sp. PF5-3]MDF9838997.1 transposase [Breznakia sp. PFB2-8]MDF9861010.1 transposase [Breznakia sp. PH5-24]
MFYYIGIDVGKFTHCACVMNFHGEVIVEAFFFKNNREGFNSFLDKVKNFINKDHICGLESTGHYGDNLIQFLLNHNFKVGLINPISTDAERKKKIRKTKTDKLDTVIICNVLQSRAYTTITKRKLGLREMKKACRLHASLMEDINQLKNQLQACIDFVFPEFNSLFKTKYIRTYMALLKAFPGASLIANANLTKLKNILKPCGRGRGVELEASHLKDVANNSIGSIDSLTSLEIQQLIARIELIQDHVAVVDKKIEEFASNSNSPIYSIPGIGSFSGTSILCEIGDISTFHSASKVVAFAGLDPSVYQSGEYNAQATAISKRGSPHLRKTLYQIALTICKYNSTFNSYYKLKKEQGKSHRCAQGHVLRKFIRVLYKLLTENIMFDFEQLV